MSEAEHVTRIAERLRKDHPDPAQRDELYAEPGRLATYVAALMQGQELDTTALERIAAAVRAADDRQPHHDET